MAVLWPVPTGLASSQCSVGRQGRPSLHPPPTVGGQLPALWEPLGLCLDWLSAWLLTCQSLSTGQGAFKANLPARHRRQNGEPSIFSGSGQGSEVRDGSSPPLPAPSPQVLGGRAGVREEVTGLSIPFPNVTSPLKRGKGPGLSGTQQTLKDLCFLVAVPRGREQNGPLQVTPWPSPSTRGGARGHPLHLGRALGVAISSANLQPRGL